MFICAHRLIFCYKLLFPFFFLFPYQLVKFILPIQGIKQDGLERYIPPPASPLQCPRMQFDYLCKSCPAICLGPPDPVGRKRFEMVISCWLYSIALSVKNYPCYLYLFLWDRQNYHKSKPIACKSPCKRVIPCFDGHPW